MEVPGRVVAFVAYVGSLLSVAGLGASPVQRTPQPGDLYQLNHRSSQETNRAIIGTADDGMTHAGTQAPLSIQRPSAPAASSGTAIVIGRVIDALTQSPIGGARVAIPGRPADAQLTDADGRFAFTDLPAGSIRIAVMKDGYADGGFGQRWIGLNSIPFGASYSAPSRVQILTLRDGDRRDDIVIRLWKYGVITGHVTDDVGDPLVGVTVQAWPRMLEGGRTAFNSVTTYSSQTDDRGVFRIPRLLPGGYVVAVPTCSITIPASTTAPAQFAANKENVQILGARASMDIDSDRTEFPIAGTIGGVSNGAWLTTTLGPAEPVGAGAAWRGYATTFAPSALSAPEAAVLDVTAGAESTADVRLHLQTFYAINGTVQDESGQPRSIDVRLVSADALVGVALSDARGQFRFHAIPPGAYHLLVTVFPEAPNLPNWMPGYHRQSSRAADGLSSTLDLDTSPWSDDPTEWADVPVTMGASDSSVVVTLRQGARISGHVVFVGQSAPTAALLGATKFTLERADGQPSATNPRDTVQVDAQGNVRSIEFPPGRYLLRPTSLPPGWIIQSAVVAGKNIVVTPLDLPGASNGSLVVTLTTTPSVLTGHVRQSGGAPEVDASVVAFPTDRSHWVDYGERSRDVVPQRVTADGQFTIRGLPAGDYYVAAIDDAVLANGLDATLLDSLVPVSNRVTVVDGQQRITDLTVRAIR